MTNFDQLKKSLEAIENNPNSTESIKLICRRCKDQEFFIDLMQVITAIMAVSPSIAEMMFQQALETKVRLLKIKASKSND